MERAMRYMLYCLQGIWLSFADRSSFRKTASGFLKYWMFFVMLRLIKGVRIATRARIQRVG